MGPFTVWHWLIAFAVILLLFRFGNGSNGRGPPPEVPPTGISPWRADHDKNGESPRSVWPGNALGA